MFTCGFPYTQSISLIVVTLGLVMLVLPVLTVVVVATVVDSTRRLQFVICCLGVASPYLHLFSYSNTARPGGICPPRTYETGDEVKRALCVPATNVRLSTIQPCNWRRGGKEIREAYINRLLILLFEGSCRSEAGKGYICNQQPVLPKQQLRCFGPHAAG